MKKISILLVLSMLVSLLAACGGSESGGAAVPSKELLTASMALFTEEEMKGPTVYYSDAKEGDMEYLDPGTMSFYFYGEFDKEMPAMELVEEYAMALPSGLFAFEITILKAKSAAAANEVKKMMDSRLEMKKKDRGEIENYDAKELPAFDTAEIWVNGQYVVLMASVDNAAIKETMTGLLGGAAAGIEGEGVLDQAGLNSETASDITNIQSSVNNALTGGGEKPSVGSSNTTKEPSAVPTMTVNSFSGNDLIVLGGKCAEWSSIHVRGGVIDYVFQSDYDNWFCEVQIPTGVSTLYVTQEEKGKAESEAIEILVQSRTDVNMKSHGVCQVCVGDKAQGHFFGQLADWEGTNLISDKQIEGITGRVKTKVDYLANIGCELIYLIVPNPMEVYPETVPVRYKRSTAETTRTDQFIKAATDAGATVIELTEVFEAHRDDEFKLFHKMDSHWTDYGAYWGQHALFEHISKTWPDAAPIEIGTDVKFYTKEVDGGDMMTHLELKNHLIKEQATFVEWITEPAHNPNVWVNNRNELNFNPINKTVTITNNVKGDRDLPTAMIIRDSFSTNIYPYVCTRFSEVYWQAMWNYKFDQRYIESTQPDYYIVLVTERNLNNCFG